MKDPKSGPPGEERLAQPLGDAEYQALGEFRRTVREFLAFSEAGAEEHGVSSQQHQALLAIRAQASSTPMSIRELASSLKIKHHSAVGLVDRMIERELIRRTESATDRRLVILELQPKGREILESISRRNLAQLRDTGKILSDILGKVRRLDRRLDRQGAWTDLPHPARAKSSRDAPE